MKTILFFPISRSESPATAGRSGARVRGHHPERNVPRRTGGRANVFRQEPGSVQGGLVARLGPNRASPAGSSRHAQHPDQRGARGHAHVAAADTTVARVRPGLLHVPDQCQPDEEADRVHRCAR